MARRYLTVAERKQIEQRAFFRCEYCQCWAMYSSQSFVYEHIDPIAKGGETHLENICFACGGCNGHKHAKTTGFDPVSKTRVLLYHPRRQNWEAHFQWSNDFLHVVGLTAVGRATVNELKLNRMGVVNMRTLLLMAGLHPPSSNQ